MRVCQFFHGGGPLQAPLYQVLESYGCYRPDVGYVQGMSHIASMLLLNMEPLPAFIAICNLLNQEMYFKFFRMNAQQMKLHLDVFQQVFKGQPPQQLTLLFLRFLRSAALYCLSQLFHRIIHVVRYAPCRCCRLLCCAMRHEQTSCPSS